MRAIGLRASPTTVWFAIVERIEVDRDTVSLLTTQVLPVPEALNEPERLRFVRQTIADIIVEYDVVRAGIRLAEPIAKQIPLVRLHLEGVLQELLASCSVERYFYGAIAQIGRFLEVEERSDVKEFIQGRPFRGLQEWSAFGVEQRESILVGVASLSLRLR